MSSRRAHSAWLTFFAGITPLVAAAGCARETPTAIALPPTDTATLVEVSTATSSPFPTDTPSPTDSPTWTPTATRAAVSSPTATAVPDPSATLEPTPPPTSAPTVTTEPSATPVRFPPSIELEPAWSGFQKPVYLTHNESDDEDRLFVVEQAGRVRMIEDGILQPEPFLDLTDSVGSLGSEQGLLSIAFSPAGSGDDAFYVNYTDLHGDTVIARFRFAQDDPRQADRSSEQGILRVAQPASNHNGGQLQFGPDGYLYIGMGDGGQGGDPWGNGQNPETLLGKMLRLDVADTETYLIPANNPFVGQDTTRPEIWALGLRNPWRFAFDRATGDLYIADVGQNRHEELDFEPAAGPGGHNYGWDAMEGSQCFEPEIGCDPSEFVLPVAEYDHGLGCSATGGVVYRGGRYLALSGVYFYGDFCSGNIWGLRRDSRGQWETAMLLQTDLSISSFGEDGAGEIYVLSYNDGLIFRLIGRQ
ncbi:MAG TPA: PQQ-dependent sugar dehydrogenase [Anaerolineae bacterium]|nr:PQQ-dependent sugar dehydrogenase [Anaerolineae bacterium]